ncbi:MAG: recombination protein NinB [Prevotella sp.]|nr:recombination protein NinB [Prevotella sp.]
MRYDLQNELKRKNFSLAVKKAWEKGEVVDLTVVKQRTLSQNSYLHVCLTYIAKEYGESLEYVKQIIFKQVWNKDIFRREVDDILLGRTVEFWRSTKDLTVEEMTKAIENMRDRASKDLNLYIPSADEKDLVKAMERETWR